MKKLSIFALALSCIACATSEPQITANISGSVEDSELNGKYVYLADYGCEQRTVIDSVLVADNKFAFATTIQKPTLLKVRAERNYANVLVDSDSPIEVLLSRSSVISDADGINDKYKALKEQAEMQLNPLQEEIKMLVESGIAYADAAEQLQLNNKRLEIYTRQISQNSDNMAGVMTLYYLASNINDLDKITELMEIVPASADFDPIVRIHTALTNAEKTKEGNMFVDFQGESLTGEPSKFSDYIGNGKYVLVDFWASWCGPCMREVPYLKNAFTKYTSDSFIVLGVNVWDEKEKCAAAVESEELNWAQIFMADKSATDLYGISGIPQIMLFAPDGTILKRNLRGDNIATQIEAAIK